MLYYLMHEVDGNAFDPYEAAPETSGKEALAEASRSPAEQFVYDLLDDASAGDPPQPFNMLLQSFIGDTGPYQKPIDKNGWSKASRGLWDGPGYPTSVLESRARAKRRPSMRWRIWTSGGPPGTTNGRR
jgi:hypothetical protein